MVITKLRISIVGDISRDCKGEDYPFINLREHRV